MKFIRAFLLSICFKFRLYCNRGSGSTTTINTVQWITFDEKINFEQELEPQFIKVTFTIYYPHPYIPHTASFRPLQKKTCNTNPPNLKTFSPMLHKIHYSVCLQRLSTLT